MATYRREVGPHAGGVASIPGKESIPVGVGGPGLACRGHLGRLAHIGEGGVGVGQLFLGNYYYLESHHGRGGQTWTPSKVQRAVAPLLQFPVSPSLLPQVMK